MSLLEAHRARIGTKETREDGHKRLLLAMLQNQIESLAELHREGFWEETPAEMSAEDDDPRVREELYLWLHATDELTALLLHEFGWEISAKSIIERAIAISEDGNYKSIL